MHISHKSNVLHNVAELEWECRQDAKGLDLPEYWTWLATITDADGVITYPSETFTIVEVADEDVYKRLIQLDDYVSRKLGKYKAIITYNIDWSDAKVNCEEILDDDGNSYDPKQYVSSHLKGDDTKKNASILADEWTQIRAERTRLLAETDYLGNSDMTMNDAWKVYRAALRTLPADQSSKTTYASITWPTKP